MRSALVTGGNGFIGSSLVPLLVATGRKVRVLDLRAPLHPQPQVDYVQGSVLDPECVDRALMGVDEVYHLAGLPGMWVPQRTCFGSVNFDGTQTVIAGARKRGVGRFLHCSTESILFRRSPSQDASTETAVQTAADMPGAYTRSKFLAEQLAIQTAASGFPIVIASPTMPIGPHDHNLTPPTAMLRHFVKGGLQFYLDFIVNLVDVRDVAAGLLLASEQGQIGHRYILGGEGIALKRILELIAELRGRRTVAIPINGRFAETVAGLLEFVADHVTHRPPSGTAEGVRIALRSTALSIDKARRELGYAPRPVEPVLRQNIAALIQAKDLK